MSLTLEGVVKAADASNGPMRELASVVVDAATMEARGNSGTIFAEVLRGLFETWAPHELIGPDLIVAGFSAASERAKQSVLEPVEGTILTVARVTAEAIASRPAGDVAQLLAVAADAAERAVQATTGQLAALRQAGVVDAAARGYELCIRAFATTVAGLTGLPEAATGGPGETLPEAAGIAHGRDLSPQGGGLFEVQYLIACGQRDAEELRLALAAIADSVVVAGDDGRYRVHVHTERAGAAIEAGIDHGRIFRVEVAYLGAVPTAG